MTSIRIRIVAAALIAVVVAVVLYAALTFPRAVVDVHVSFTAGVDRQVKQFDMPILHGAAQVQVVVTSGTTLWRASIYEPDGTEIWSHITAQGYSTTYQSEWIALPNGHYNFTFGTIGIGNLDASVTVTSKGGFW